MPVHEELGRRNVKLLANVFADLDQLAAALAAAAGLGFVAVFDARQMLRQGLATGTLALAAQLGQLLLDLGLDGGAVGVSRLAEQVTLFR